MEERCLRGDFINEHKYLMGGSDEDGSRLFSLEPIYRTRDCAQIKTQGIQSKQTKTAVVFVVFVLFCFAVRVIKYKGTPSQKTCPRCPCVSKGIGLDDFKRSLPA